MSHTAAPGVFPEELVKASKSFERCYLSRHSGRRLTWQPSLGNADVRVTIKSRKHDLNVSTFACVILLLFEDILDGQFLTYEVIFLMLRRKQASLWLIIVTGNTGRDIDPGSRAEAATAISRLCKMEDLEEAPSRTRR